MVFFRTIPTTTTATTTPSTPPLPPSSAAATQSPIQKYSGILQSFYQKFHTFNMTPPVLSSPIFVSPHQLQLRGGGGGGASQVNNDVLVETPNEETATTFSVDDIFKSHSKSLEVSDNPVQTGVIRHHYWNEFGKHISMTEVLKDYTDDCLVHVVIDGQPNSYKGHDGIKQVFKDLYRLIPHDASHFELEHIAINHDHAQVVWKARLGQDGDASNTTDDDDDDAGTKRYIRGTDSFAFDTQDNHRIKHQTTVALTWQEPS